MAVYVYTAYRSDTNEIVKGKVEAADIRSARTEVRNLGFIPTEVTEEQAVTVKEKGKKKGDYRISNVY